MCALLSTQFLIIDDDDDLLPKFVNLENIN